MGDYITNHLELLRREYDLGTKQGFVETHLKGVRFFWSDRELGPCSMVYPAGLMIIGQGRKIGFMGKSSFQYDADTFLIVSVSTPFECKSYATKEEPLLGIFIDIDIALLNELSGGLQTASGLKSSHSKGIEPMKITPDMRVSVERLVKCLTSQTESRILGQGLIKEILFRVMQSEHGRALFALTMQETHQSRITQVIDYIRHNFQNRLTVEELASQVNMSTTSFHRAFKLMTGLPPLQYVKNLRLSKARSLIVHDGMRANVAATEVGYESASQFTREFKRYFNVTPAKAKGAGYAEIDLWSASHQRH